MMALYPYVFPKNRSFLLQATVQLAMPVHLTLIYYVYPFYHSHSNFVC